MKINRRQMVQYGAALSAGLAAGRSAAGEGRPNVVVIMADDLGWGDLGCYGSEAIATPNLDRLAAEGIRMTSFFSSGAVCSPSRAGLLTGRYPVRSGVNFVFVPKETLPALWPIYANCHMPLGLPANEITMAQAMKAAGYATCCVGKWHLGDLKRFLPTSRGFDHYFGVLHSNDAVPLRLYRDEEVVEPSPVDQDYLTRKYTEEAVEWLRRQHGPFLLYMAHTFPHIPLHASPEFQGRSRGGLYGDAVEEIDWSCGEIMKTLDELGQADNTLVVFTSDNGPWFEGSSGISRGRKGQTLDGGMRVPLIVRWPGRVPAGMVTDEPAMNFDLFATALTAAGAPIPDDRPIDGRDLMGLFQGGASPHEALYFYDGAELQAVRSGRWKYHRVHSGWSDLWSFVPKRPSLFDLETDPNESYNVIEHCPKEAARLEDMMRSWERGLIKGVPRG